MERKTTKCETVISITADGLYSNAVEIPPPPPLPHFWIEAPWLGLHLNLHDDPNMNEQTTVLLT